MVRYFKVPKLLINAGACIFTAGNGILAYGEYLKYQGAPSEGMKELLVDGYLPMMGVAAACWVCAAFYVKYVNHRRNSVEIETSSRNVVHESSRTIETLVHVNS